MVSLIYRFLKRHIELLSNKHPVLSKVSTYKWIFHMIHKYMNMSYQYIGTWKVHKYVTWICHSHYRYSIMPYWGRATKRSRLGTWLVSQRSWVRYSVRPHTCVSPSADSRGAIVSYWWKYMQEVLVNSLGGLSLPRKSVVRLTDRPDMTLDAYRGRKTTQQQQQMSHHK